MINKPNKIIDRSVITAGVKRSVSISLMAASLLASFGMTYLPINRPITYPANGNTVVRRSEMGGLTGTTYDFLLAGGPGHDFGATYGDSASGIALSLPSTFSSPIPAPIPGHDLGAIRDETGPALRLLNERPFSYTINGVTVLRPSELGPLTLTVDPSIPISGLANKQKTYGTRR